jgi:ADP-heptose:LPS heptosyltransferase
MEGAPKRICVFRALQLGDMLCAGPALRALRAAHPGARITLVGLPWAASYAQRMHAWIDDFAEFPGWPGLPERDVDEARVPGFLGHIRGCRFDLAVQLHGSGRLTNAIVRRFGAARTVGHRPHDAPDDDAPDGDFWPYPEHLHEIHRNLHLVGKLGAAADDDALAFPLAPEDTRVLVWRLPAAADLEPASYACIHPGARDVARRWPPSRFAAVADALAARGLRIVITGNEAERELATRVASLMHTHALNAACDIPVGALAALLSNARLLVTNDTGVSHLAAALRVPSVVLFIATDPKRWAPLDGTRHVVLRHAGGVSPDEAIEAASELLRRDRRLISARPAAASPAG